MIAIIDYGVGNLRSVEKAFHFIGCEAVVSSDCDFIMNADAVVLPGVGAYAEAMDRLNDAKMVAVVKETIQKDKPFLGICLGMQLLFDYSEEGGAKVPGLGIFEGAIKLLPADMGLKVPHMGWNSIDISKGSPLFEGLSQNPYVYFVHSYGLEAKDPSLVVATSQYGITFDAAVGHKRAFATQFHPEKSGEVGLKILKNWVAMIGSES